MQTKYLLNTCAALTVVVGVVGMTSQAKAANLTAENLYAPGTILYENVQNSRFRAGGAKWGTSQTAGTPGGTVTYSFMPTGPSCTDEGAGAGAGTCPDTITTLASFMPAGFQAEIKRAFDAWSAVANIQFQEVVDSGTAFNAGGAQGNIRIGGHVFDGVNGILAHAYLPEASAPSFAGDIHFDIAETWKIGQSGVGFNIFQVTAHEIGHAIGLEHTDVANSLMNPIYTEAFFGPQADDIAGARAIYGSATVVPTPSLLAPIIGFGLAAFKKRKAVKA